MPEQITDIKKTIGKTIKHMAFPHRWEIVISFTDDTFLYFYADIVDRDGNIEIRADEVLEE
jgi:hypothetical protein